MEKTRLELNLLLILANVKCECRIIYSDVVEIRSNINEI